MDLQTICWRKPSIEMIQLNTSINNNNNMSGGGAL